MSRNLDQYINAANSCEYDLQKGERGGIRVRILMDYVYVHKKEANGDVAYTKCIINMIRDPYFHNLAIVSNNKQSEDRISNIDIDAIYFKNFDSLVYQDKAALAAEKLELSA